MILLKKAGAQCYVRPSATARDWCVMAASNTQPPAVKPNFKTPEGRYKLSHEKTHFPPPHYGHVKAVTQVCTDPFDANIPAEPNSF